MDLIYRVILKQDIYYRSFFVCRKTTAHDEEVRKLYEEMETQIRQEKDKILSEVRT